MADETTSNIKRPLEKEPKKEPKKKAAKQHVSDPRSQSAEQPSKKVRLEEEQAEKPADEAKDDAKEAPKEEGAPKVEVKKGPTTMPPEAKEPESAAPAADASDDGQGRPVISEKDSEGRIRKPSNPDILLGRGKPFQNHPGNQRMLRIVDEHKERYLSEKRDKKRAIVEEVLDIIQRHGARFLKRIDHGEYWREVEPSVSFEKVSHALRSKVRRPEGFEVHPNNSNNNSNNVDSHKGPLPILPEGSRPGDANQMAASLYNQQFLQQRGMFPDAATAQAMGLMMANPNGLGLPSPFGHLMPNMFNPNLMRLPNHHHHHHMVGGGGQHHMVGGGQPNHNNNMNHQGLSQQQQLQNHHNGNNNNNNQGQQQLQHGQQHQQADLEQLVRSQMVDSLLRQRQQLDEALNDVAGCMRLPPNYNK